METKTPEFNLEDYSILAWVMKNQIRSEKGEILDFHDRLFLLDILTDWSREITWKKCSQVGGSIVFNIKTFFALLKLGWNIIYTMPSDSDVESFVKAKTNPLILANPHVLGKLGSDAVYIKQIGDRFLHFKGTISKTAAISTSSDLNIHDEASRSDQATMNTYKSRLTSSKYKGTWMFSNPTTEKDALDEKWLVSDQKEWHITCACGEQQVMTWPESIDKEHACYQCKVCKKELTREERRRGVWINRDGVVWDGAIAGGYRASGWHTSHMMMLDVSARDILDESEGDQEYFYNFVLGEPYNPGDLKVTASTILDNWTPKDLSLGKQWYLGVDVGNIKHYVLGTELGVVKVGRFSKWSELDDMMKMYKPNLVIDAMPDNTMSKYYVDTYPTALMSFFQDNKNNPNVIVWWGKNTGSQSEERNRNGIVYSNRNRIIDKMIDDILNAKILFGVPSDFDLKQFIKHWQTLRRIKVADARGIESYEWDSTTGEDHYVFATLYYYLARLGVGAGALFTPETGENKHLIDKDGNVGDIGAIMAQVNSW